MLSIGLGTQYIAQNLYFLVVRRLSSQIGEDEKDEQRVRSLRIMERQEFSFNASVLCWGKFGILFKNDKYAKPSKERYLQRCLLKFAHSKEKSQSET